MQQSQLRRLEPFCVSRHGPTLKALLCNFLHTNIFNIFNIYTLSFAQTIAIAIFTCTFAYSKAPSTLTTDPLGHTLLTTTALESSLQPPSNRPVSTTQQDFVLNERSSMPRTYPQPGTDHKLSPSIIDSTAGFTAGVVSTLAVHPFDVVKTRLQVNQSAKAQVGGSLRIARDIARNEGQWTGFYRGLTPNIIGNSVSWGLYFMW